MFLKWMLTPGVLLLTQALVCSAGNFEPTAGRGCCGPGGCPGGCVCSGDCVGKCGCACVYGWGGGMCDVQLDTTTATTTTTPITATCTSTAAAVTIQTTTTTTKPGSVPAKYREVQKLYEQQSAYVRCMAYSRDGEVFARGHEKSSSRPFNIVDVYNATTPGMYTRIQGLDDHNADVNAVVFSPASHLMVTASSDTTIIVYDKFPTETGSEYRQIQLLGDHLARVWVAVFSPNGNVLVTASDVEKGKIITYDASVPGAFKKLQEWQNLPNRNTLYITSVAFSPNCDLMVTASKGKEVDIYDVSIPGAYKPIQHLTLPVSTTTRTIAFSLDGHVMVASDRESRRDLVGWGGGIMYDATIPGEYKEIQQFEGGCSSSATFNPRGGVMAARMRQPTEKICIYDSKIPGQYTQMDIFPNTESRSSNGAVFSPSGNVLALGQSLYRLTCTTNQYFDVDTNTCNSCPVDTVQEGTTHRLAACKSTLCNGKPDHPGCTDPEYAGLCNDLFRGSEISQLCPVLCNACPDIISTAGPGPDAPGPSGEVGDSDANTPAAHEPTAAPPAAPTAAPPAVDESGFEVHDIIGTVLGVGGVLIATIVLVWKLRKRKDKCRAFLEFFGCEDEDDTRNNTEVTSGTPAVPAPSRNRSTTPPASPLGRPTSVTVLAPNRANSLSNTEVTSGTPAVPAPSRNRSTTPPASPNRANSLSRTTSGTRRNSLTNESSI